jgi:nucleoside-diphosphate-sugar epimerase
VRDRAKAGSILAAGGAPAVGDVLDLEDVRRAVVDCGSIVQVAAAHPESDSASAVEYARRVRVEGTQNLAIAAQAAGARRLIVGSGYWVYADQPGQLTDDSSLDPRGESQVNHEAEQAGLGASVPGHFSVSVVRPGMVYGDGSWFRGMVDSIRAGTYSYPGDGANHWSLVELGDAAAAFRTVLEYGAPDAAYLVVDDAPISLRDLATLLARELDAPVPPGIALEILSAEVGPVVAHHLAANRAGSNRRLRDLGWVPRYPDCREGLPVIVGSMARAR